MEEPAKEAHRIKKRIADRKKVEREKKARGKTSKSKKDYVYRSYPHEYFTLFVNAWLPHEILKKTENQVVIDREPDYNLIAALPSGFVRPKKGTVRLNRKDLLNDSVARRRDGYYSLKKHMEFFSSQSLFTQKQYDVFGSKLERQWDEYLCSVFEDEAEYTPGAEPARMLFSFKWLETEPGGIWRWENRWKYSFENLVKDRQMIYSVFAHKLEERDFGWEEENDRWNTDSFFGGDNAGKNDDEEEEYEESIGGLSQEIMDALTTFGMKNNLRGLTLERIKTTYRKLVKRHHPDVKKNDKSDGKIKEINAGYHTLKILFKNAAKE